MNKKITLKKWTKSTLEKLDRVIEKEEIVYTLPKVILRRGTESVLEKLNRVLEKGEIVCTLPDELKGAGTDSLIGIKCKYKIGDGEHLWRDLEYEEEKIPVVFTKYEILSAIIHMMVTLNRNNIIV